MLIYNVTVKVDAAIASDWLRWLNDEHIPEIKSTGCFTKAVVLRLLETDDSDGPTYAVQYYADSNTLLDLYIKQHAVIMRNKSMEKWGNQFIAIRSVLEVVN